MTTPPTDEHPIANLLRAQREKAEREAIAKAEKAGERRGIERAIEALKKEHERLLFHGGNGATRGGVAHAVYVLESLRDAPVGEPRYICASCGGGWAEETVWCPHCAKKRTGEQPAKPAPAGEEAAITCNYCRGPVTGDAPHFVWTDVRHCSPRCEYALSCLLDGCGDAEVKKNWEAGATSWEDLVKLGLGDRPAPAAKEAGETIARLNLLVDGLRQNLEEAEEERDHLRARVAELEASASRATSPIPSDGQKPV